jgi:hypothetical protein
VADFGSAVLKSALRGKTLEIRSNLAPPVVEQLDELAAPGDGGPSLLLSLLRLSITVREPSGAVLYHVAPAGEPWAWGWVVALVLSSLLSIALVWLVRAA